VARKNRSDAIGSGKIRKTKSTEKSTSGKRIVSRKRSAVAAAKAAEPAAVEFDPADEQIRTRAYFISERRRRFDLPGDANSDWIEAKRQLLSEIRR
jgi:hypothetical protein